MWKLAASNLCSPLHSAGSALFSNGVIGGWSFSAFLSHYSEAQQKKQQWMNHFLAVNKVVLNLGTPTHYLFSAPCFIFFTHDGPVQPVFAKRFSYSSLTQKNCLKFSQIRLVQPPAFLTQSDAAAGQWGPFGRAFTHILFTPPLVMSCLATLLNVSHAGVRVCVMH